MALWLIPMRHSAHAFRVERDGDPIGFTYRDLDTGEWLLTADAVRFEDRAALPAPSSTGPTSSPRSPSFAPS